MDLKCRKCGEPFDNDHFHEIAKESHKTYQEVARAFAERGCEGIALKHNENTTADPRIGILYDLLGDDIDGVASEIEDYDLGYSE